MRTSYLLLFNCFIVLLLNTSNLSAQNKSFSFTTETSTKQEPPKKSKNFNFQVEPTNAYKFNIDPNEQTYEEYISQYVSDSITVWQKRGEFEPTSQYRVRVTEHSRASKIKELTVSAEKHYIAEYCKKKEIEFTLDKYDPDNESFLLYSKHLGNIVLEVPLSDAPKFKESWTLDPQSIELYISGRDVRASNLEFISNGKRFKYDKSSEAVYARANINLNLPSWQLEVETKAQQYAEDKKIKTTTINVGQSDVDINIPKSKTVKDDTFVIIIANENYIEESTVSFAINDGSVFKEYCVNTLGIPESHIRFYKDATLNVMRKGFEFASLLPNPQNLELIVYYAGHGIPDEATKKSYLLPTDGYASSVNSGYSLDKLYDDLGSCQFNLVTYFIDACFSGSKRDEGMLASARGVALKAKEGELKGNSVSFSAASGVQTAYPYEEKGHGLFTYYLLKKLQETKGKVSYSELGDYLKDKVGLHSVINNDKSQNPSVSYSTPLTSNWGEITF